MTNVRKLKNFDRTDAPRPAAYYHSAVLPPRELFADHPEILDAYDEMTTYQAAVRDQGRLAAEKRGQIKTAQAQYREDIAAAMAAGEDTTTVRDQAPRLAAEAAAHDKAAREAKLRSEDAGRHLGALVQAQGAELFDALESQMNAAAGALADHVETMRTLWGEWGQAWALRKHLSEVVHRGGSSLSFNGSPVPAGVSTALASARVAGDELAQLKDDETKLAEWRDEQAANRERNERILPGPLASASR